MIYEINTRVWLKQFSSPKLIDVPQSYWETLKNKGVQYIWLMGIWQTVPSTIKKYCFVDGLIKEYDRTLPDWKEEDVIGSPYAIDRYEINHEIASKEEILKLKKLFNSIGLKLILDFIPNHFSAETTLLKDHDEIFLKAKKNLFDKDDRTFFIEPNSGDYYAHGKDPYFEAWQDT
ncbi:MAG: glycosidase, partial [Melioribacteraceae bacterium]|nr:glycosidase [Melioribacteraceae bacterium]